MVFNIFFDLFLFVSIDVRDSVKLRLSFLVVEYCFEWREFLLMIVPFLSRFDQKIIYVSNLLFQALADIAYILPC